MMLLQPAVWGTAALAAGPWLFQRSFRDWRTRRLIQNTPTARIRSMAMGLVEVSGVAVTRCDLVAPFSGRPCAWWELDIATQGRKGVWSVVHRNQSRHPFYVRDETGLALVDPAGARATLGDQVEEECSGIALPDVYADYLRDQHLGAAALWRMGRMRFRERLLEDGQRTFVFGTAAPRPQAVDLSDADGAQAIPSAPVIVTSTAPVLDVAELHAQRIRALDAEVTGVIRRGASDPTFIISQQSERDLAFQLGLRASAELVGGPALTLLGLGIWLAVLRAGGPFH